MSRMNSLLLAECGKVWPLNLSTIATGQIQHIPKFGYLRPDSLLNSFNYFLNVSLKN